MTNADRIRNMSTEELADLFDDIYQANTDSYGDWDPHTIIDGWYCRGRADIVEWLKATVEDDEM